jgi:tellurite resistance-related uncharacterized protein
MGRKIIIAVVAATIMLVGATAAFAATSHISAKYNATSEAFHGKVTSGNDECLAGRTVKVFKKTSSGKVLQGKTMTNATGGWKLSVMHAHGKYIAYTPAYEAMHTTCDAATSAVVDVM